MLHRELKLMFINLSKVFRLLKSFTANHTGKDLKTSLEKSTLLLHWTNGYLPRIIPTKN